MDNIRLVDAVRMLHKVSKTINEFLTYQEEAEKRVLAAREVFERCPTVENLKDLEYERTKLYSLTSARTISGMLSQIEFLGECAARNRLALPEEFRGLSSSAIL